MDSLTKFPRKAKTTASRIIDGEAVIVIPEQGQVRVLNESGSRIWQLLDGKHSIADIANKICSEFNLSQDQACEDTVNFIAKLRAKEMVVLTDE